ncbi:hypothetical protein EYF80_043333 [Liparis tanakae]|uniref:Uncharacterized protein n=1 Tax=Liparis tanakae TaxID=230148 RepID=A0A4Z2G043_9TELE|nr:hypothetical protein EYF80_043333 [Liparis tanakae]
MEEARCALNTPSARELKLMKFILNKNYNITSHWEKYAVSKSCTDTMMPSRTVKPKLDLANVG